MDRLFVPLASGPFEDFEKYNKKYEIRSYGRGFTEKFVYVGRDVELRKGYSGESIWGKISEVTIGDIGKIFQDTDFKLIEPRSNSITDAIEENIKILGKKPKYIAFRIDIN